MQGGMGLGGRDLGEGHEPMDIGEGATGEAPMDIGEGATGGDLRDHMILFVQMRLEDMEAEVAARDV